MTPILVSTIASIFFGFAQSLAVGAVARRWDSGHGILWALLLAPVGGIGAWLFQWFGLVIGFTAALIVFVSCVVSLRRNQ